jgi:hypothetical protein
LVDALLGANGPEGLKTGIPLDLAGLAARPVAKDLRLLRGISAIHPLSDVFPDGMIGYLTTSLSSDLGYTVSDELSPAASIT